MLVAGARIVSVCEFKPIPDAAVSFVKLRRSAGIEKGLAEARLGASTIAKRPADASTNHTDLFGFLADICLAKEEIKFFDFKALL